MYNKLKAVLTLSVLGLLVFCLGVLAFHLPGWSRALDASFVHFDKLVGEASIAAKNVAASSRSTKESADAINQRMPVILDEMQGSLNKFNTLLDSSDVALHSANSLINTGNKAISEASLDVRHIAQNADLLTIHFNNAIDALPPTLDTARQLMGSASLFIDKPLTKTVTDLDSILYPAGLLTSDVQKKTHTFLFPDPYTGKHPVWHRTWGITKGVAPYAQPLYYFLRTARGQ
jgi:uncharacterized protein YoxC